MASAFSNESGLPFSRHTRCMWLTWLRSVSDSVGRRMTTSLSEEQKRELSQVLDVTTAPAADVDADSPQPFDVSFSAASCITIACRFPFFYAREPA